MDVDPVARQGKEAGMNRDSYVCKGDVVKRGGDKYDKGGWLV